MRRPRLSTVSIGIVAVALAFTVPPRLQRRTSTSPVRQTRRSRGRVFLRKAVRRTARAGRTHGQSPARSQRWASGNWATSITGTLHVGVERSADGIQSVYRVDVEDVKLEWRLSSNDLQRTVIVTMVAMDVVKVSVASVILSSDFQHFRPLRAAAYIENLALAQQVESKWMSRRAGRIHRGRLRLRAHDTQNSQTRRDPKDIRRAGAQGILAAERVLSLPFRFRRQRLMLW
jgi:hypothetical protein